MNKEQYESLKKKLLKLQALAERGYKGEAKNARTSSFAAYRLYAIRRIWGIGNRHAHQ